jgi:hypothetical protein
MLTFEQTMSIVRCAVLAPSADNRHVMRFQPTGYGLRIWADPAYLAYQPHRKWLCEFSFGAAVENALLSAGEYGATSDAVPAPDPATPGLLFDLRWRPSTSEPDALARAIEQRQTNRKFFKGPALARDALARFDQDALRFPEVGLNWCDDSAVRGPVLRLLRLAEAERFLRHRLHEELFGSIRWDVGWRSSCDEGLPPGALEVEPPLRPFFKGLAGWPLMRALSKIGTHWVLAMRAAYMPALLSPHLGVLTTAADSLVDIVAAGRCFQRIWLRATALGCALQPFAANPALIRQVAGAGWVSSDTQAALNAGWARIYPNRRPVMVFRMGYAAPATVRAGRRPVEAYLGTGDGPEGNRDVI